MADTDRLPFVLAYGDPELVDCACAERPFARSRHSRDCLRQRADAERERELAEALTNEDADWLAEHGWDGRFEEDTHGG